MLAPVIWSRNLSFARSAVRPTPLVAARSPASASAFRTSASRPWMASWKSSAIVVLCGRRCVGHRGRLSRLQQSIGGPLVDLSGRVVGINTAIESQTGFFTGAGFAIPITLARKVANDIIEHGVVHRPRLGIEIEDVTSADAEVYKLPAVSGVEIISITPNEAAARANVLVLYPEQTHRANRHGCWNWFRPEDQRRDRGEPGLLMAMVQDVMARHRVDAGRIYVAGLSAGGAMAALLAREYPDVFAAAGVHSGLPAGAAHNMMTALSAMKHGAQPHARTQPVASPGQRVVPVIVFHGDADEAVHARNGDQVVAATLGGFVGGAAVLDQVVEQGASPAGQLYTRTVYRRALISGGRVVAEHWLLRGGGHAWSGGSAQGSYTDPAGVSATDEMLRFFLSHRR